MLALGTDKTVLIDSAMIRIQDNPEMVFISKTWTKNFRFLMAVTTAKDTNDAFAKSTLQLDFTDNTHTHAKTLV